MRIAIAGASHWHAKHYITPVLGSSEHVICGVSDADGAVREQWSRETGAPGFADHRQMYERTAPDFVIVLGRHIDMAATVDDLIDRALPCLVEKPCGTDLAAIASIADKAERRDAFVTVPFAYRISPVADVLAAAASDGSWHASLRYFSGPASRYASLGVGWVTDPAQSGGGCTLNLAVHLFDLLRYVSPTASWEPLAATMSSGRHGWEVETYSAVLVCAAERTAVVESGYGVPGSGGPQVAMSFGFHGRFLDWLPDNKLIIRDPNRAPETTSCPVVQSAYYRRFLLDALRRAAGKRRPLAGLHDALEAARIVAAAYALAGQASPLVDN